MNNLISNFPQIMVFAEEHQLPLTKTRAIVREYLQSKILEKLYQEKISKNIYFVGGTALRLLYDLDRFSEDLDFDVSYSKILEIKQLVEKIHRGLINENLRVDLYQNITQKRAYYELRFKDLLYELNITRNQSEKLSIKLDFEYFWKGLTKEVVLFRRYGFVTNVITLSLSQLLVQKLYAYLNRSQTLPRDIYDIVWLITQHAVLDHKFLKNNKLNPNLLVEAIQKFEKESPKLNNYKRQLAPFLINEDHFRRLYFFPKLLQSLIT